MVSLGVRIVDLRPSRDVRRAPHHGREDASWSSHRILVVCAEAQQQSRDYHKHVELLSSKTLMVIS